MKTNTFSIVVGTSACNADCPFCVSKMTDTAACTSPDFNEGDFNIACRIVDQMRNGLVTVMLTGKGEPMLFPNQITKYIDAINFRFPLIELQTNGTLIGEQVENLKRWKEYGLTLVCISIVHPDKKENNGIMGIKEGFDYWESVKTLQDIGLNVRLNCTMMRDGVDSLEKVERMIHLANLREVNQITFREVEYPEVGHNRAVIDWVKDNQTVGLSKKLHHFLELKGATRLLDLPHGGIIYEWGGQNVAVSNCLTETTDPNDIRQIIFFPSGQVAYSWQHQAARLL